MSLRYLFKEGVICSGQNESARRSPSRLKDLLAAYLDRMSQCLKAFNRHNEWCYSGRTAPQIHMMLFQQGPIHTFMSGTMIDLVSDPIDPGEYRLEISVTMGGVEIFLPRCVQFTLEGSAIAGGRNVHEGPGIWETMKQKLHYVVHLPEQPPDFALAPSNPERPVRIHFVTHIMMGGVDIYQL